MFLEIKELTKEYEIKGTKKFKALDNVNLSFGNSGLVTIYGKSGSGKSTLLNLIGRIDKPSSGNIFINKININDKNKYKRYYNEIVSIVFQQYCLIDDQTVLINVMLPFLINGCKKKAAKEKALELLKFVNVDESLFLNKCYEISGGEKQRVAIARALAIDPQILLCDEPTGALDSYNAENVMKLLKKVSNKCLVIVVSHNLQLSKKYSDRIIEISNGRVRSDVIIQKHKNEEIKKEKNKKTGSEWVDAIALSNFKRRASRNLLSAFGFSIGLTSLILTIGFINGKNVSLKNEANKILDYAVGIISSETTINSGSLLKLTKSTRPEIYDVIEHKKIKDNFEIAMNYDAILPSFSEINYNNQLLDNINFTPIFEFDDSHINKALLQKGRYPKRGSKNEVVINLAAYDYLKKLLNVEPIGITLNLMHDVPIAYIDLDDTVVVDDVYINEPLCITGVCDELNYLTSNKIYYSFTAYDNYFDALILPNISTYFNKDITVKSRIFDCDGSSPLSSYSFRVFPKAINNIDEITENFFTPYNLSYTSSTLMIKKSLESFFEVGEFGLDIFLIISLIGVILILGIISFANYSDDHKKSAILSCFGATNNQITSIYCYESVLAGFIGIIFSIPLIFLAQYIGNIVIFNSIHINNLIVIPFVSFLGYRFLLPLLVIVFTIVICLICSSIPISLSKRISLKEELQSI